MQKKKHKPKALGLKYDHNKLEKPPLDLIPTEMIWELGKVLAMGEGKYGTANWANGIHYRRLISAAMRHLLQFNSGEDVDKESHLPHLAHSICNLTFLLWMTKNRSDLDDRWVKGVKK